MDGQVEERLQRVEESVDGLAKQLPQLFEEMRNIRNKLDEVLRIQGDHHAVLYGQNGQPGLVGWSKITTDTLDELKLALKGVGDKPGLIAVINDIAGHMEEMRDDRKWMIRLVVGAVITAILTLIIKG